MKNDPSSSEPKPRSGRPRSRASVEPVQTLDRALTILQRLAESQPATITELSRATQLHSSTVYRILETLKLWRYAEAEPDTGRYRIGVGAFETGCAYLSDKPVSDMAHEEMTRLAAAINESVNLAVRDAREAIYVKQISSSHSIRLFTQVGARVSFHCSGIGKVLLIDEPAEQVADLLGAGPYLPFTSSTITTLKAYLAELDSVREQGFAWDNEERETGVRCLAAPIRDSSGKIIAAVSISAPTTRMSLAQGRRYAPQLIASANRISERLGYRLPS